jgi:cytochrome c oxidase assembly factor CtaG
MMAIADNGIRLVNVAIAGFYSVHVRRSTRAWNGQSTLLFLIGFLFLVRVCVLGFRPQ